MSSESPFETPRAPDGASCSVPPTTPNHLYQLTGPQMEAYSEENIRYDCPVTTLTQLKHRGDSQTMACGLSTTTLSVVPPHLEPLILQRQSSSATSNTCSATTPVTPISALNSSDTLFSSSGFSSEGSSEKRQVNYVHILPSPGVHSAPAYLSCPAGSSSTSDMV